MVVGGQGGLRPRRHLFALPLWKTQWELAFFVARLPCL